MKKRLLTLLVCLCMTVSLMLLPLGSAFAATGYNVWVGGTQVTDANKDDVLGDGHVSYNAGTNTLTLTGATVTSYFAIQVPGSGEQMDVGIYAADDLNISIFGTVTVDLSAAPQAGISRGIAAGGDLTISGAYLLKVTAGSAATRSEGIFAQGALTFDKTIVQAAAGSGQQCSGVRAASVAVINGARLSAAGVPAGKDSVGIRVADGGTFSVNNSTVCASGGQAFSMAPALTYPNGYYWRLSDEAAFTKNDAEPYVYAASQTYAEISPLPAFKIVNKSLPDGTVGTPYSVKLVTSLPSTKIALLSGALPDGLTLASDGTISGTPTKDGTFEFHVSYENAYSGDQQIYSITVAEAAATTAATTADTAATTAATTASTTADASRTSPKTGDGASWLFPALLALVSCGGLAELLRKRRTAGK